MFKNLCLLGAKYVAPYIESNILCNYISRFCVVSGDFLNGRATVVDGSVVLLLGRGFHIHMYNQLWIR